MNGHEPHSLEYLPVVAGGFVFHYTCNAPPQEILGEKGIVAVGGDEAFGCANPREVLRIPLNLCSEGGDSFPSEKNLQILRLEKLMRILS